MSESQYSQHGWPEKKVSHVMIQEYIPIAHLVPNSSYNQIFMIEAVEFKRAQKPPHRPYAWVTVRDVTGYIQGFVFQAVPQQQSVLAPGKFVRMSIVVNQKSNSNGTTKQFTTELGKVNPIADEPENVNDYIAGPNEHVLDAYQGELETILESVEDPDYRDLLNNAYRRMDIINKIRKTPYGVTGAIAYRGGLLIHICKLLKHALSILQQEPEFTQHINRSLVIAGCILRNIGYISTIDVAIDKCKPNHSFKLLDPQTASFMITNHLRICAESDFQRTFPGAKMLALQNICKAKHPTEVHTAEGKIVLYTNLILDMIIEAGATLQSAKIGTDEVADSFFIGHLIHERER